MNTDEKTNDIESTPKTIKCLNCGTEFQGKYCPECTQSAKTGRFTFKFIVDNLISAVLGHDSSIWFTLKNLFTRPGAMIVEILNGKRKRYFSPFPMLFCVLTIDILLSTITGSNQFQATVENDLFSKCVDFYTNHFTLCYMLTLPLFVLAARICFGKNNRKRYYPAEYIIAVVYVMVIEVLFECLSCLIYLSSPDLAYNINDYIPVVVFIVAFSVCFKKMMGFNVVSTIFRSILVVILYYLMLFSLLVVFAIVWYSLF